MLDDFVCPELLNGHLGMYGKSEMRNSIEFDFDLVACFEELTNGGKPVRSPRRRNIYLRHLVRHTSLHPPVISRCSSSRPHGGGGGAFSPPVRDKCGESRRSFSYQLTVYLLVLWVGCSPYRPAPTG